MSKRLNRWLFTEVLPAIRKTGSYSVPGAQTPDHLAQLRRQRIQINEECALIQAQRRLERTAKDEARRILRGSNDIEAYRTTPDSFSSTYGLVMEERSDNAGKLLELRLTASTRELFQAFRMLDKTGRLDCPFKSTSQMGAEVKKSEAILRSVGWRIERNVKKVRGSRKHAFIWRGDVLPVSRERGQK